MDELATRLSWQRLSIKEGSEGPNVEEFAFQFKTPVQATPHPPRPVDTDALCETGGLAGTGHTSAAPSSRRVLGLHRSLGQKPELKIYLLMGPPIVRTTNWCAAAVYRPSSFGTRRIGRLKRPS